MYDEPASNPPSANFLNQFDLVKEAESGRIFTAVAAVLLRVLAVAGCLAPLAALAALYETFEADSLKLTFVMFMFLVSTGVGALLSWKVLFSRARRMADIPATGNAAVGTFREMVRAWGESVVCWAMTAGVFGPFTAAVADDAGPDGYLAAVLVSVAVAAFAWCFLLYMHMLTAITSALTDIADNTAVMAANGSKQK